MPTLVTHADSSIRAAASVPPNACIMCSIRDGCAGPQYVVEESAQTLTVLARFPRRWGHCMVILREHHVALASLPETLWLEASKAMFRAGRAIERALAPRRVFLASLGAPPRTSPLTSPHLHLHMIPTYDDSERPSVVFNSQLGYYDGSTDEWEQLQSKLRSAL